MHYIRYTILDLSNLGNFGNIPNTRHNFYFSFYNDRRRSKRMAILPDSILTPSSPGLYNLDGITVYYRDRDRVMEVGG